MSILTTAASLHDRQFGWLERKLEPWFLGLSARLIFSSVLLFYFLNSALTKLGDGPLGLFSPSIGAYAQIVPPIVEAAGYDSSQIAFLPWGLIVLAGTLAEFILPILILIGLATRVTAIAFIGFIAVMTFVDIQFHGVEAETIGHLFDSVHNSAILDQRLLWLMPLLLLIIKGPGTVSVDHFLARWRRAKAG
ncbi:putative oxidoreductase [Cohaesibacter marisflavi]|uniref:Putative oxidoreductase n=1 Tax=Cohaesibacter marisflavi TaxID=655353 RepID=A0A1I5H6G7_9HYPH|nr:DoxX family membrane protein [Cohaesibacter marisflavi]SFO43852.1 putative oxidoreductase [Cohaesibacter marisflavi]